MKPIQKIAKPTLLLLSLLFIFSACELTEPLPELPIDRTPQNQNQNTAEQDQQISEEDLQAADPFGDFLTEIESFSAKDCLEGEEYDPVEKVCFYECETEEECAQIEADILKQIENIGEDFYEGEKDFEEPQRQPESEDGGEVEGLLVTYTVTNGQISNPQKTNVTDPEKKALQDDTEKHQKVWAYFNKLFPQEFTTDIAEFEIFTDGKEQTFGAIAQTNRDPTKWLLSIDLADAFNEDEFNTKELTYTLIHEFGHLLTLNSSQVNLDQELFNYTGQDSKQLYLQKEKACRPSFFIQEGCTKENSTINKYFQKYWADKAEERSKIEEIENDTEFEKAAEEFYQKYKDQFVTDYAATNPVEDIAESWTAFILQEKPENPNSVSQQKIVFFYDYPLLLDLQKHIRQNVISSQEEPTVNN